MTRVAVVTGGTRGIGEAICLALRDQGVRVAANYVNDESRAKAFTESTGIPSFRWDVACADECQEGIAKVTASLGSVDILVNNAGITRDITLAKMSVPQWREVININLTGSFNMVKPVFDDMKRKAWGRIINISSINGQAGQFGQANYSAAKAGLLGFTKALAQEGARFGITVNSIAPGYIETDMVTAMPPDALTKVIARIPVGRLGSPFDIARGVAFLAAEDAAFITGSTLTINGGQYLA